MAGGDDDHDGHEGDIYIGIENGALFTGLIGSHDDHDDDHDDDHEGEFPEERVFAAEMGELGIPGFTSDPGWEAFPDTFDADTWLGWNAMHGLGRWNGSGFDESLPEILTISYGSNGPSFDVGDAAANGFELACAADGSFHLHLNFLLSNDTGGLAESGVYLLELEMYALNQDLESSEPFWIVFNNEGIEEDHEAAIEWVEENLAEEEHCDADLDGDHDIDVEDLLSLIEDWGCEGESCAGDVNDNGITDIEDLLDLIADFGGECH
ncbi:MAG: hypothetical protein P8M22_13305 [Phycisphaerales bacterium]|nr:hypothetical protein [Phycisphaerales bacterium]